MGLTNCRSTSEADSASALEWKREGDDIRRDVTDDHHLRWVVGDEFGRHDEICGTVI